MTTNRYADTGIAGSGIVTTATLRNVCKGLDIPVPEKYLEIADRELPLIFRPKNAVEGCICLIARTNEDYHIRAGDVESMCSVALENGAEVIIVSQTAFEHEELEEDDFPVILIDDASNRIAGFFNALRDIHKRVVMLTGSIGKTTTKDMCAAVASAYFDTYSNKKNTNTPPQVIKYLFHNSNHPHEVYIQECGAGYRGSVRYDATMLRPDIFILTNIYAHHFQLYKNFENLMEDKTSADDLMDEQGVIITNYDDERIRNHPFRHKVISFGINDQDVDYLASNIRQDDEILKFDVKERSTGIVTPVEVSILGSYNVYNAIAAFAMGRQLGLTGEQISDALKAFETEGVRQNFINIGGVHLFMDCYNVAEESITGMLKAGEEFPLEEGNKRAALIGGENKLGKKASKRSLEFGRSIGSINFDYVLFCGREGESKQRYGDAKSVFEGFRECSEVPCSLSMDMESMMDFLKHEVSRGDLVMLKGIYLLDMPMAVDKVFGTSFSYELSHNLKRMDSFEKDGYQVTVISPYGMVFVTGAEAIDGVLTIPDQINGDPVFQVRQNICENPASVKSVDLGNSVMNIGSDAFAGCTELSEIMIPGNVKIIESSAFRGCTSLSSVLIGDGVTHIGSRAFADCPALKRFQIPSSVGRIEDSAFEGAEELLIICPPDSYAWDWAEKHGIRTSEK